MNVLVAGMFRFLKTEWEVRMIAMSVGVQNRQRCSCYLVYFVSFVDSVGSTAKKRSTKNTKNTNNTNNTNKSTKPVFTYVLKLKKLNQESE